MEKILSEANILYILENNKLYRDNISLEYINSGLESSVFRDNDIAIKIYHKNPEKKVLSEKEIDYFRKFNTKRVILPKEKIFSDSLRGYTMNFIDGDASSIYSFSKDKLIHELSNIYDDLIHLGNNYIFIDDLRNSNYLSNNHGLYLIDCGEYIISSSKCSLLNIAVFEKFFVNSILKSRINMLDIDSKDKIVLYRKLRYYFLNSSSMLNYIDNNFSCSIDEEIKKFVKKRRD